MKKLKMIIIFLLTTVVLGYAQDESIYKFFYIAHSGKSDKRKLCDRLIDEFDQGLESNWNCVFYLANNDTPIIASTRDMDNTAFNSLIAAIQNANSHDCRPFTDLDLILDYLEQNPFIDEYTGNVKPQYQKVYFNFYINSSFWNTNGQTDLIVPLYEALDAGNLDGFELVTLISRENKAQDELGKPFNFDEHYPYTSIAPKAMNSKFNEVNY